MMFRNNKSNKLLYRLKKYIKYVYWVIWVLIYSFIVYLFWNLFIGNKYYVDSIKYGLFIYLILKLIKLIFNRKKKAKS